MRYSEMTLAAQTAYAELFEQTRAFEMTNALGGLKGSFQRLVRKGKPYWYFAYRDPGQPVRMAYLGADDARVQALIARFSHVQKVDPLLPSARAAVAHGCIPFVPKHFRIIKRLAEYGFFHAGGILIGTHAFLALGNMFGLRWHAAATPEVDFTHPGCSISVALPASFRLEMRDALQSLEMGLLPVSQFNGFAGAWSRGSVDQHLCIDLVTSQIRNQQPILLPELNVDLKPLRFLEYLLEQVTQGCVFGNAGACTVNLPTPERLAVHKLIIYGERFLTDRIKSSKDLMQAASLTNYLSEAGQWDVFNLAWHDAVQRGKAWEARATVGRAALIALDPALGVSKLWT